jgi:hypothetical protein
MAKPNSALITASPAAAVAALVNRKAGLSTMHEPLLSRLTEVGFKEKQVESLVDVIIGDTSPSGRPTKVSFFLKAVMDAYSDNDLLQASRHYEAEQKMHREVSDVESLRRDAKESFGINITYHQAILFFRECGRDQTFQYLEGLSKVRTGWMASKTLADRIKVSKADGRVLDTLINEIISPRENAYLMAQDI